MRSTGLLALALLAAVAPGCRAKGRTPCVVVLGVDALHLPLLDHLVKQGALPNFGRLYREGSVGPVSTVAAGLPSMSPRIWTSFATGHLPAEHGIDRFTRPDERGVERPLSSRDRRVAALWEIASASGKRVGVVNWLATYPAEPVNGFVVTDIYLVRPSAFVIAERTGSRPEQERLVWPAELGKTLGRLGLVHRSAVIGVEQALQLDRAVFVAAFAAWNEHPVDLLMIYTRGLDEVSHILWWTHEPREGENPGYDGVVEYMRRYDGLLGELLARLGPEDHLVVLSDHGVERNPAPRGPSGVHASAEVAVGVQAWWGPGVPRGVRRAGLMVDVTPTLLELLGISPSADMPGSVLWFLLDPGHVQLARRPQPYARLADTTSGDGASAADADIVERLRALGYVQ